jgi:hypothetical protein
MIGLPVGQEIPVMAVHPVLHPQWSSGGGHALLILISDLPCRSRTMLSRAGPGSLASNPKGPGYALHGCG